MSEIILILFVAFLLFGSKKVPEIARGLGKGYREFQKATDEIKNEINKVADDVKEQVNNNVNIKDEVINPIKEVIDPIKDDLNNIKDSSSRPG